MSGTLIGVMSVIVAAFVVAMIWEGIKEWRKMKAWERDFQAKLDAVRRDLLMERALTHYDHLNRMIDDNLRKGKGEK